MNKFTSTLASLVIVGLIPGSSVAREDSPGRQLESGSSNVVHVHVNVNTVVSNDKPQARKPARKKKLEKVKKNPGKRKAKKSESRHNTAHHKHHHGSHYEYRRRDNHHDDYWHGNDHYYESDQYLYVRVVDVEPLISVVQHRQPVRDCRYHGRHGHHRHQYGHAEIVGPLILGGIIGGIIGNQLGDGSGQDLLTVGGALLGAGVAVDLTRDRHPVHRDSRHGHSCSTSYSYHEERRIDGYRVTYVYNGRTYSKRMGHDPGRWVKVRAQLVPLV